MEDSKEVVIARLKLKIAELELEAVLKEQHPPLDMSGLASKILGNKTSVVGLRDCGCSITYRCICATNSRL